MTSLISEIPPATPSESLLHFSRRLAFETDCSDVHQSQNTGNIDYVLVDVRNNAAFAKSHVPGAINIPTRTITAESLSEYPRNTLFVVYCAGPHCNGVHRAAVRLSGLGYSVKEMIGGITGWVDEGLPLQEETVSESGDGFACEC
ncbi:rhodanese-like domain-containing protein [Klebsiella sp. BIGb0407]|uniref:rhodanese-like domain-containing protein n=1 Tax=Klebsiella sp. BIGb0407 TaxID=2940603 RepID=UPI0021693085|nr:rhodanese-like domain-containing protein [Klebsiella sp. BIGb0407]MCS3432100.1 rhodanese-related sulfurtransferase [Klebsiella sp. BIGb0407]